MKIKKKDRSWKVGEKKKNKKNKKNKKKIKKK